MTVVSGIEPLPGRAPEKGELVKVRSRTWLVDDVKPPAIAGQSSLVSLSCADDDAQGQSLDVFWDYELDRQILKEEGWRDLATKGFDAETIDLADTVRSWKAAVVEQGRCSLH